MAPPHLYVASWITTGSWWCTTWKHPIGCPHNDFCFSEEYEGGFDGLVSVFPVCSYCKWMWWWKIDHWCDHRNSFWNNYNEKLFEVYILVYWSNGEVALFPSVDSMERSDGKPWHEKCSFTGIFSLLLSFVEPSPVHIVSTLNISLQNGLRILISIVDSTYGIPGNPCQISKSNFLPHQHSDPPPTTEYNIERKVKDSNTDSQLSLLLHLAHL